MATLAAISSIIIKKTSPLHNYKTSSVSTINCPLSCMNWTNVHKRYLALGGQKIYQHALDYPTDVPGASPPEFPQAPPPERYNVPLEVPQTPNVPDFDPIPPPLSPGENPGPPSPSTPKPEAPVPPLSPPGQPEGPEIMPSQPPDIPRPV